MLASRSRRCYAASTVALTRSTAVGILFNVLFVRPIQRELDRRKDDWHRRKDAGEKVFPLKPDSVFLLCLIAILPVAILIKTVLDLLPG